MDIDALLRQLEQLTDSFQPAPDLTSENSQQTIYEIHRILQQASQQIVALVGANPTSLEQTPVQTSSALSESQAYLRAMFDSVQEYAIFTVDLNNRITTWNSGAERLFRFSEQEALGQSSAIIFTPEDRAEQGHPSRGGLKMNVGIFARMGLASLQAACCRRLWIRPETDVVLSRLPGTSLEESVLRSLNMSSDIWQRR
jgi:PAS domain-containing protein